jgi:hypothetical protein
MRTQTLALLSLVLAACGAPNEPSGDVAQADCYLPTITLQPVEARTATHSDRSSSSGYCGGCYTSATTPGGPVAVGESYAHLDCGSCVRCGQYGCGLSPGGSASDTEKYRGVVRFDLGAAQGRPIVAATLKFKMTGGNSAYAQPFNQLGQIGVLTSGGDQPDGDWFANLTRGSNVSQSDSEVKIADSTWYSIEASRVVRDWASGAQPNAGFVLRGAEDISGGDRFAETSTYDNFVLEVTYNAGCYDLKDICNNGGCSHLFP